MDAELRDRLLAAILEYGKACGEQGQVDVSDFSGDWGSADEDVARGLAAIYEILGLPNPET